MPRTFQRKNRLSALSEINVTPLIDLAFSLLIIFMITAPLLEQTIPLNLPAESQSPQSTDEKPFQVVSIDKKGEYYWGKENVSLTRIKALLADVSKKPEPPVIHLRADESLPYQKVITLVDLLKQYQLNQISLDTEVR